MRQLDSDHDGATITDSLQGFTPKVTRSGQLR